MTVLHFLSSYATFCFVGILAELLHLESRFSLRCCTFALGNANALQQVCMNVGCTTAQDCIMSATLQTRVTNSYDSSINWLADHNDVIVL